MQDLGTLGGINSSAFAVSADGSVIVGSAENAARQSLAFRWTAAAGIQELGTLAGGTESRATAVSMDGGVVVGIAYLGGGQSFRAFRWTAAGGMQHLGTLPGATNSQASGVSADGRVVVGASFNSAGQYRAFRWTAASGMQDLGTLGGTHAFAAGISADGLVVVGEASNAVEQTRAFRWESVRITSSPVKVVTCPAGAASFDVTAVGTNYYRWQRETSPNTFVNIPNGRTTWDGCSGNGLVFGATTRSLTIVADTLNGRELCSGHAVRYRCVITNSCGSTNSTGATLTIVQPCGLADIASDSLQDTRCGNGSMGPEDLDAFIAGFIADNAAIADVASDSLDTTFTPNGAVGPEDLDAFIASFIAGC